MCGDRSVGKSCLVLRFTKGTFTARTNATIGAAFSSKARRVRGVGAWGRAPPNSRGCLVVALQAVTVPGYAGEVKLHIWDTAGEEAYRAMTRSFFREANGGERRRGAGAGLAIACAIGL